MKAASYARVSIEGPPQRGTIGSQLAVADDGHSGARLDRPRLDAV
jgi:hypothetical protein